MKGFLADAELIIMQRAYKHGLTEEQITHAWRNAVDFLRIDTESGATIIKAIGFDSSGKGIEISAREQPFGMLIYHANTPPTARALREFGLSRR